MAINTCSFKHYRIICALFAATMTFAQQTATAKPRTESQMRQTAMSKLSKHVRAVQGQSAATALKEITRSEGYVIYAQDGGGFAVVSTDDVAPEILGYSDTEISGEITNTNFKWWLEAVNSVVKSAAQSNTTIKRVTKPDTQKYDPQVSTLCTSRWDQEEPYWNMCPMGTKGRCLTGCVATAMSQVLYYHKGPAHGIGTRTIYYPANNASGTPVTADFGNDTYDWTNMVDTYTSGSYTTEQGNAVALLMRDCGVATNMDYSPSGSGAYHSETAAGLRQYFGIESAKYVTRSNYSEKDWMEMIYDQITRRQPIIYGGDDMMNGGHSFVLDGYDEDGFVHINWGWSGSDDGFYDIALLNPGYYTFSLHQDAVIDITPEPAVTLMSDTVSVSDPGKLRAVINDEMFYRYDTLRVEGKINGTDLKTLRAMAGRDEYGERTEGTLRILDLKDAQIVAGGDAYLNEAGTALTLDRDSILPRKAFFGCTLRSLLLPNGIKSIGTAALASTNRLDSVLLRPADDADFILKDNIIYSTDSTTILAALPRISSNMSISDSIVTVVGPYAFSSRTRLSRLTLGRQLQQLGEGAFSGCASLSEIRVVAKTPIAISGAGCFEGVDKENCTLSVRAGSTAKFKAAAQWGDFKTMAEYGTTLKARNAIREYGDANPRLGWSLSGDYVEGTPVVTCLADTLSPVGRYTIHIAPGTVTSDAVDYEDGFLIVTQAPLIVGVRDTTRSEGEQNPDFTFTYSGFKNCETADVAFSVLPQCQTEADILSPAGSYTVTPVGGEAPNYELSYTTGTLTVTPATTSISAAEAALTSQKVGVYSLSGQLLKLDAQDIDNLPAGTYILKTATGSSRKVVVTAR